jgi:pyruvate formate lyase activating enzyme
MNRDGRIVPVNYGKLTSISMDPIEKKPFARFFPGSMILSVGSFGCSLACPFCQNHEISQAGEGDIPYRTVSPEELADLAMSVRGNLGIAFTYNEPLIAWEYIRDTGKLLKKADPEKKIAVVTNGMAEKNVLEEIMPYVDAMNIDYKGDSGFYRKVLSGSGECVRDAIEYVYDKCHLEVTTLVIPGVNDDPEWIGEEASWLASLDDSIPLHLSRYFPRYRYDTPETPRETILELAEAAERYLKYVYAGNM